MGIEFGRSIACCLAVCRRLKERGVTELARLASLVDSSGGGGARRSLLGGPPAGGGSLL